MQLLTDADIKEVISWDICKTAVLGAMQAHAAGEVIKPDLMHADCPKGEFHIKVGGLLAGQPIFGAKINGGFFGNPSLSLPSIQGVIYVADATNGSPLAVLDSARISRMRTAAASFIVAKRLADPDSSTMALLGTGSQAMAHLECFRSAFPIKTVRVWGRNPEGVQNIVKKIEELGFIAVPCTTADQATEGADIIVSATGSRTALVTGKNVKSGAFIAGVGADSPGKQEWEPEFVASCKVVTDITSQCVNVGEIQHALKQSLMTEDDIWMSAGELLSSDDDFRSNSDRFFYDSTGTALQDVAVAAAIVKLAATT